jgi:hypothetical protein
VTYTEFSEPPVGTRIANTNMELNFVPGGKAMLGEPTHVPSETLIDMLFAILGDDVALTASDAANIEQIQRELQRRGNEQHWDFRTIN